MRQILDDHSRRTGWRAQFQAQEDLERADGEIETACFRIALEALTNVVRHAKAKNVSVELSKADQFLHFTVRDDGIGFDLVEAEKKVQRERLGLIGMRERAVAVGGLLECKSEPGKGTELHAFLPFKSSR